jgi:hypothetical protein
MDGYPLLSSLVILVIGFDQLCLSTLLCTFHISPSSYVIYHLLSIHQAKHHPDNQVARLEMAYLLTGQHVQFTLQRYDQTPIANHGGCPVSATDAQLHQPVFTGID